MKTLRNDLPPKLLRLTGAFEGGGVAGNFDGQILSFGPLQWNLGRNTLEAVLLDIYRKNPNLVAYLMGRDFTRILETEASLPGDHLLECFIKANVLDKQGRVAPPWKARFLRLAETPEAQAAFVRAAKEYLDKAQQLCETLGFESERGLALCFDVAVQNGAPRQDHIQAYRRQARSKEEWKNLKTFAKVVADLSNPRWREDVLSRKTTIAVGSGTVHGRFYDLEKDFGISYARTWFV